MTCLDAETRVIYSLTKTSAQLEFTQSTKERRRHSAASSVIVATRSKSRRGSGSSLANTTLTVAAYSALVVARLPLTLLQTLPTLLLETTPLKERKKDNIIIITCLSFSCLSSSSKHRRLSPPALLRADRILSYRHILLMRFIVQQQSEGEFAPPPSPLPSFPFYLIFQFRARRSAGQRLKCLSTQTMRGFGGRRKCYC